MIHACYLLQLPALCFQWNLQWYRLPGQTHSRLFAESSVQTCMFRCRSSSLLPSSTTFYASFLLIDPSRDVTCKGYFNNRRTELVGRFRAWATKMNGESLTFCTTPVCIHERKVYVYFLMCAEDLVKHGSIMTT